MTIADRYRKGVPPVAGGSLDQTNWINEACEFVDNERSMHLSDRGLMGMMLNG